MRVKIISFVSGKGGVGKSTLTAQVSKAVAKTGNKTLVIELDIPLRSLDHLFSVVNRVVYDLDDIINGRPISEVALEVCKNLYYIPSSINVDTVVSKETLIRIIDEVKEDYDFCFIDCKAGIDSFITDIVSISDIAAIVITPDEISVRDGAILSDHLHYSNILTSDNHNIIINKVDTKRKNKIGDFDYIIDTVGASLLGVVPLFTAKDEQHQISKNIAERLLGKRVSLSVK